MDIRKENVQMIVTLNQRGEPVYQNGVPALLEASLRRLRNNLEGQVLHCEDEAYSLCKAVHPAPHILDMNGSHIDDISKAYREDNYDFQKGVDGQEISHFMVDYPGSTISLYGLKSMFIVRGFVSRIHIAQYHDQAAPPTLASQRETTAPDSMALTPAFLEHSGYKLESTEWETLPVRAGGPTCAKFRHSVWRHKSAATPTPLFLVDNTAWPISTPKTRRVEQPKPVPVVTKRVDAEQQLLEHTGYRKPNWA